MKQVNAYYIGVIFILALMGTNTAFSADHACADCHNSATPNKNDLKQALSGLCADCHAARIAAGEHAVDIPATAPENTLPLQAGNMTCITCHDPHQPRAALRKKDPQICWECHKR